MLYNRLTILENDGNDVKSRFNVQMILQDIGIGRRDEPLLFLPCHRDIGIPILVRLASLHLHDDYELAVPCNNVDFLVDITPVSLQDLVALLSQVTNCKLLAQSTEFVVRRHRLIIERPHHSSRNNPPG